MTLIGFAFIIINGIALLLLPRRWACLPLLVGSCYISQGQKIAVGPIHFSVIRSLILVGFVRGVLRRELTTLGLVGCDWAVLGWGTWLVAASVFHNPPGDTFVTYLGVAYNCVGIYLLIRSFCRSKEDAANFVFITCILLGPLSLEMMQEKVTGRNLFAVLGGVSEEVVIRDGKLRAQGPFGHAILAGTVGASCVPLMFGIWRSNPMAARLGVAAAMAMMWACTSSGPIMTFALGAFAVGLWPLRMYTRKLCMLAVVCYMVLDLVMKRPGYFILAKIDITGSSTGWHRAELIRSARQHLGEWWFAGTDYTRHWMPTGVYFSPNHADITNQYIQYGVYGGLFLISLFMLQLWLAFTYVGRMVNGARALDKDGAWFVWCLGSSLFAHAVTCISVSYYDQSSVFMFAALAVISSMYSSSPNPSLDAEAIENRLLEV